MTRPCGLPGGGLQGRGGGRAGGPIIAVTAVQGARKTASRSARGSDSERAASPHQARAATGCGVTCTSLPSASRLLQQPEPGPVPTPFFMPKLLPNRPSGRSPASGAGARHGGRVATQRSRQGGGAAAAPAIGVGVAAQRFRDVTSCSRLYATIPNMETPMLATTRAMKSTALFLKLLLA